MGTYHGEEGFRELSHAKSVFKRHRWFPIGLFYPPYGNLVQRLSMWFYLGKEPFVAHAQLTLAPAARCATLSAVLAARGCRRTAACLSVR